MARALIGRYEIFRRLGAGGMGEVFLARDSSVEGLNRQIVVKRIYPHLRDNEHYRRLFVHEAKIAATLVHPNIVQVLELGEDSGELFIAMELVSGCDLAMLLRELHRRGERLSSAVVGVIAFDVLEALDFAHGQRDERGQPRIVVHQDVSPQNILLSRLGYAKLCDFGVARVRRGTGSTTHGAIRGKYAYMAPEQLAGGLVDPRTDLYALGVVLYECLSGATLFGDQPMTQLLESQRGPVPPLHQRAPDQDAELCSAVERAIQPAPDQRYPSAADFMAALEPVLLRCGPSAARAALRDLITGLAPETDAEASEVSRPTLPTHWDTIVARGHEAESSPSATIPGAVAHEAELTTLAEPSIEAPRRAVPGLRRSRRAVGLAAAVVTAVLVALALSSRVPSDDEPASSEVQTLTVSASREEHTPSDAAPLHDETAAEPSQPAQDTPRPAERTANRNAPRKASRASTPQAAEHGTLNLNATPWAYVTIDGQRLEKTTPLRGYRLPAGRHVVMLQGPEGQTRALEIMVRPNEAVTRLVRFTEE